MSYRVACEASDVFAAVAVSAGTLATEDLSTDPPTVAYACTPDHPVSMLHVHGLDDGCVPFVGGLSEATGHTLLGIEDSLEVWETWQDCTANDDTTDGPVRRRAWACSGGAGLELITVEGLGHAWAGSQIYGNPERCGGTTTQAVSTTTELWRFFQANGR